MDKSLKIVSFEQAKCLKKLGFNWLLREYYQPNGDLCRYGNIDIDHNGPVFGINPSIWFSAPTIALALKWFRDVKGYKFGITPNEDTPEPQYYGNIVFPKTGVGACGSYDNVENALLDILIEIAEKEYDMVVGDKDNDR
jgi:hypothetical protein